MTEMLAEVVWNEKTLGIVCAMSVPVAAIGFYYWHKVNSERSVNDLKRSMVERGMSAAEIERVMSARQKVDE